MQRLIRPFSLKRAKEAKNYTVMSSVTSVPNAVRRSGKEQFATMNAGRLPGGGNYEPELEGYFHHH